MVGPNPTDLYSLLGMVGGVRPNPTIQASQGSKEVGPTKLRDSGFIPGCEIVHAEWRH